MGFRSVAFFFLPTTSAIKELDFSTYCTLAEEGKSCRAEGAEDIDLTLPRHGLGILRAMNSLVFHDDAHCDESYCVMVLLCAPALGKFSYTSRQVPYSSPWLLSSLPRIVAS